MARKGPEAVLILQAGESEPEVYDGISDDDVSTKLKKRSPEVAQRLDEMLRRVDKVRREVVTDPDKVIDYFVLQSRRAEVDAFLSEQLQEEPEDRHRGRIEAVDRIVGIGTAVLYEHANFSGASKTLSVTMPDFRYFPRWGWPPWTSFNDRVSSARYWGANILFEHTWYTGRRLYMVGLPYGEIRNFTERGFNDIASSYVGT